MTNNPRWDIDLTHGEIGEGVLAKLLGGHVEVKRDRKIVSTGNIAVEFSYKNQPSGILATTSEWWSVVCDDSKGVPIMVVSISTERFREWIRSHPEPEFRRVHGGDKTQDFPNGVSHMVLVPFLSLLNFLKEKA